MEALDQKDLELERLATLDKENDGLLSEGANFDERDDEIVVLQREKAENMSDGATSGKKMTVKEKIEKELAYVTEAMDLDYFGQRHWHFKLKREYEEQEKTTKRLEKL